MHENSGISGMKYAGHDAAQVHDGFERPSGGDLGRTERTPDSANAEKTVQNPFEDRKAGIAHEEAPKASSMSESGRTGTEANAFGRQEETVTRPEFGRTDAAPSDQASDAFREAAARRVMAEGAANAPDVHEGSGISSFRGSQQEGQSGQPVHDGFERPSGGDFRQEDRKITSPESGRPVQNPFEERPGRPAAGETSDNNKPERARETLKSAEQERSQNLGDNRTFDTGRTDTPDAGLSGTHDTFTNEAADAHRAGIVRQKAAEEGERRDSAFRQAEDYRQDTLAQAGRAAQESSDLGNRAAGRSAGLGSDQESSAYEPKLSRSDEGSSTDRIRPDEAARKAMLGRETAPQNAGQTPERTGDTSPKAAESLKGGGVSQESVTQNAGVSSGARDHIHGGSADITPEKDVRSDALQAHAKAAALKEQERIRETRTAAGEQIAQAAEDR